MIILDFGSGNTCKGDPNYIIRMIDELDAVDSRKHEVVIKWQLFSRKIGDNEVLQHWAFSHAFNYAATRGYKTTASVFDKKSLNFLLGFDIPFVKIANRPDLYWLAGEVPRKIPVYASTSYVYTRQGDEHAAFEKYVTKALFCISKYPATLKDYEDAFCYQNFHALVEVSDHTATFELYNKYKPKIYECHYKLDDSTGLDAGPFARTPEQLKEIL